MVSLPKTKPKKEPAVKGYIPVAETVYQLATYGMSQSEIGQALGKPKNEISAKWSKEYHQGRADIKTRLRKTQLDVALNDKNVQMLIHLGKFFLGQSEKTTLEIQKPDKTLENVDTEELLAIVKQDVGK